MPVEIASTAAGDSSMSFVLPRGDGAAAPTPLDESEISIEDVPARLVAVKAFPGLVTDEEVERQRQQLLAAVEADGSVRPAGDDGEVSVLQYNPPYTVAVEAPQRGGGRGGAGGGGAGAAGGDGGGGGGGRRRRRSRRARRSTTRTTRWSTRTSE